MEIDKRVKVSIIMGIYNCERTLPGAIESILDQTYTNWELIMCDDASKDRTYEVAKEFAEKYPEKIKLIKNEENRKLAYSLNRCLEIAEGELIARMDADDLNLPERIEKEAAFLMDHPEFDLVACRAVIFDENGDLGIRVTPGEHYKEELIRSVPFLHPTIMLRKTTFDKLNGYTVLKRTERGQDVDLYFRFYAAGYRAYALEDVLYKYHESIQDYKKRSMGVAINMCKTSLYGQRLLRFPLRYRIYVLHPILSAITPNYLKYLRRKHMERKELTNSSGNH